MSNTKTFSGENWILLFMSKSLLVESKYASTSGIGTWNSFLKTGLFYVSTLLLRHCWIYLMVLGWVSLHRTCHCEDLRLIYSIGFLFSLKLTLIRMRNTWNFNINNCNLSPKTRQSSFLSALVDSCETVLLYSILASSFFHRLQHVNTLLEAEAAGHDLNNIIVLVGTQLHFVMQS